MLKKVKNTAPANLTNITVYIGLIVSQERNGDKKTGSFFGTRFAM